MKYFFTAFGILYTILMVTSVNGVPWTIDNAPVPSEIHDAQTMTHYGGTVEQQNEAQNCSCPVSSVDSGKHTVVIFLSSTRPNRMSTRMGKFVQKAVERAGMLSVILDPAELPFEMLRETFKNGETEERVWLRDVNSTIASSNAFMVVSAEYNGEMPPALTNMLDHFPFFTFANRPTGLVTYSTGHSGGARVAVVLRPFLSTLGMVTLPSHVAVPKVSNNIDDQGSCTDPRLLKNINQLANELNWFANALENYKKIAAPLPAFPLYS